MLPATHRWSGTTEGRSWGGLSHPKLFGNLHKASACHWASWPQVLQDSGPGEVKRHRWGGTGPRAAASGVGKACGVVTGSGETQLTARWVLLATAEVIGLGAGASHGWLQGGSWRVSPPEGSWGDVARITDGCFLFFFQMSPGTECLGRTFPGKLGK